MKNKILLPVMALAMMVTAGVNYKMVHHNVKNNNLNISSIINMASAYAELTDDEMDIKPCSECGNNPNTCGCSENDCQHCGQSPSCCVCGGDSSGDLYGDSWDDCSNCDGDYSYYICDYCGYGCDVSAQGCGDCGSL